jgi:hypothetical protein
VVCLGKGAAAPASRQLSPEARKLRKWSKQIRETLSWQPRFDDLSGAPDQPIQRIQRIRN